MGFGSPGGKLERDGLRAELYFYEMENSSYEMKVHSAYSLMSYNPIVSGKPLKGW